MRVRAECWVWVHTGQEITQASQVATRKKQLEKISGAHSRLEIVHVPPAGMKNNKTIQGLKLKFSERSCTQKLYIIKLLKTTEKWKSQNDSGKWGTVTHYIQNNKEIGITRQKLCEPNAFRGKENVYLQFFTKKGSSEDSFQKFKKQHKKKIHCKQTELPSNKIKGRSLSRAKRWCQMES